MDHTIIPWKATSKELQHAANTDDVKSLLSKKCIELKNLNMESKHALFLEIRKDPKRRISYEEMLGIGEVFGDTKPFSSCLIDFVTKEQAFELIKQCIYFATMGRKIPIDYDDKEMILSWAKNRLQFFK